jgi:heat shock protein HslJ
MRRRTVFLVLANLTPALVACATPAAPPPTLAGTQWQLTAIQSMDDAQGTTRPSDPQHYTVSFGADGRAAFRLDCNRASTTWQITPSADGLSGQLSFGALAATRAHCGPHSLDQRLASQLPYVRSYLLRDGQLHLSLMADGGILSWSPLK